MLTCVDECSYAFKAAFSRCAVQRRRAVTPPLLHVRTTINQEMKNFYMSSFRGRQKSRPAVKERRIHFDTSS